MLLSLATYTAATVLSATGHKPLRGTLCALALFFLCYTVRDRTTPREHRVEDTENSMNRDRGSPEARTMTIPWTGTWDSATPLVSENVAPRAHRQTNVEVSMIPHTVQTRSGAQVVGLPEHKHKGSENRRPHQRRIRKTHLRNVEQASVEVHSHSRAIHVEKKGRRNSAVNRASSRVCV